MNEIEQDQTPARVGLFYLVVGAFVLIYGGMAALSFIWAFFDSDVSIDHGKAMWLFVMVILGINAIKKCEIGKVKTAAGLLVMPFITLFFYWEGENTWHLSFMCALGCAIICMFTPVTLKWAAKVQMENKQKAEREETRKKDLTCPHCGGSLPGFNITACMHCGRDVHPVDSQNSK